MVKYWLQWRNAGRYEDCYDNTLVAMTGALLVANVLCWLLCCYAGCYGDMLVAMLVAMEICWLL